MKKHEIDMTSGSITRSIVLFSLPLIFTSVLQLLYNAVDVMVVGRFEGDVALAAVGATAPVINLFINVFMGYATGAAVIISRSFGAKDDEATRRGVNTCILMALVFGFVLMVLGVIFAKPMLGITSCPENIMDSAVLYLKIYFMGMPAFMLYNFGAGILRAVGDTKRPLKYLALSGMVNVVLNLVFVGIFHMGVAGVAVATTVSQVVSAALVIGCLIKSDGSYHLELRGLRGYKRQFFMMTAIGFPAGIQSSMFSISNVIIQSAVNSFGANIIAANTIGGNIDGFLYVIGNAISQAALTFTGQNFGANKTDRIKKGIKICFLVDFIAVFGVSMLCIIFSRQIVSLFTSNEEVIHFAQLKLYYIAILYFVCGFYEILSSVLRGMGCAFIPMIPSIFSICGFRVLFIMMIFPKIGTFESLFLTYPISWTLNTVINAIILVVMWKRLVGRRRISEL